MQIRLDYAPLLISYGGLPQPFKMGYIGRYTVGYTWRYIVKKMSFLIKNSKVGKAYIPFLRGIMVHQFFTTGNFFKETVPVSFSLHLFSRC